ncbi:alpha/beta fold hydrolase [Arthrobacter yangruifuii]|uniref:Alpha/beta fold hydrolase n=1 Tax=Arthrobacter yangruifuii TaxID=2606616 RepID=A0A5N6MGN4_9MICC|nr:alpha/beta fold hydrolase [Arthrobacter yangruifuii]KAD3515320.1 alpha/beta fold hydrolase [Arthrobacter yangruifuii]
MTNPAWNPVVLWSKPEAERAGTPLLVLFHGYLANEEDLMGLTDYLPDDFTIASVRAPQASGPGYTWFPLMSDADYSVDAVVESVADVAAWLDTVKDSHTSVSLLGFSMGMAVATTLLRHRPRDFAAVVGLSGFVVPSQDNAFFHDEELEQDKVQFFWGRDQADPVIDAPRIEYTHAWLNAHTALTKILYSNMGHGINMQELGHVKEFLAHTVLRAGTRAN